jgi:hypothetical protein
MTGRISVFTAGIVFALAVGSARADSVPNTNCALINASDASKGFTCNVYESDGNGNPSDISNVFDLNPYLVPGGAILPGYLVLMATGDPSNFGDVSNESNWSDVLVFAHDVTHNSIQLLSEGCNNAANLQDVSCFPSVNTVIDAAFSQFILESTTSDPTKYTIRPDTYNIYSPDVNAAQGAVNPVPEPASLTLFATGLTGLLVRTLKRRK